MTMPPPQFNSRPRQYNKRQILDEDDYVRLLSAIIERNYFPETSSLREQLEVLNNLENNSLPQTIRNKIVDKYEAKNNQVATASSSSSKLNKYVLIKQPRSSDSNIDNYDMEYDYETVDISQLNIDHFFRKYTSEDNDSFEQIHARDKQHHRETYHWAYESIANSAEEQHKSRNPHLYYIGDKVLSIKDRERMDMLLAGEKTVGDDRPSQPDSWSHRVRNQLMFPPVLQDSEEICRIPEQNHFSQHLTDMINSGSSMTRLPLPLPSTGDSANQSQPLITDANAARNQNLNTKAIAPDKESNLVIKNTSLNLDFSSSSSSSQELRLCGLTESMLSSMEEAPHTPSIFSDAISMSETSSSYDKHQLEPKEYRYVSMVQPIVPGERNVFRSLASGRSGRRDEAVDEMIPMFTFGELFDLPRILDPSPSAPAYGHNTVKSDRHERISRLNTAVPTTIGTADTDCNQMRFELLPERSKDGLARELDAKYRQHKRSAVASIFRRDDNCEHSDNQTVISLKSNATGRETALTKQSRLSHSTDIRSKASSAVSVRDSLSHVSSAARALAIRIGVSDKNKSKLVNATPFGGQLKS